MEVSRETLRPWMREAKLWPGRKQPVEKVQAWRPRRSRWGELVQWDPSDQASLLQTAEQSKRGASEAGKDRSELEPTQSGRALEELGITWIPAHSPPAKGRVERGWATAQDRLVKGLRVAGVTTLEPANHYRETEFLPWGNSTLAVAPANGDDAHRQWEQHHDLAAILSQGESRRVNHDYTIQWETKIYQMARQDIGAGLGGAVVRVEKRRDATVAVRFGDRDWGVSVCPQRPPITPAQPAGKPRSPVQPGNSSEWNKNFDRQPGPKVRQAALASGPRREAAQGGSE